MDTQLLESGMDPELAKLGVCLQPTNGDHGLEIDLLRSAMRSTRPIRQAGQALSDPTA